MLTSLLSAMQPIFPDGPLEVIAYLQEWRPVRPPHLECADEVGQDSLGPLAAYRGTPRAWALPEQED
jgi:hypothetical protein